MAVDLMNLTDSPSNLTHLDISGAGLGIGAAELAAHLLKHPVGLNVWICERILSFLCAFWQL
jgi:hypothetical protein